MLYEWLQLIFYASVDEKYLIWSGDCSIVDAMALLLLLLLTNKFINILLVILLWTVLDDWHIILFVFMVEVVVQVKPFYSLQHDLSSRSVFTTNNQIILWQSVFLKGSRNTGTLFYPTIHIIVYSGILTVWQAALNE